MSKRQPGSLTTTSASLCYDLPRVYDDQRQHLQYSAVLYSTRRVEYCTALYFGRTVSPTAVLALVQSSMGCTRQQNQLTNCSCESLMDALTMFCEPAAAAARAWVLIALGGAEHAEGSGPGNGAVVEPLASDCSSRTERRSLTTSLMYTLSS